MKPITLKLTRQEAERLMSILAGVEAEHKADEEGGLVAFLADPEAAREEATLADVLYRRLAGLVGGELF